MEEIFKRQGTAAMDLRLGMSVAFRPVFLRVHFVRLQGSGTDTGAFELLVDDGADGAHNVRIWYRSDAGVGKDVNLRWLPAGRSSFAISPPGKFKVTWANPDTGDLRWGVQLALEPVP